MINKNYRVTTKNVYCSTRCTPMYNQQITIFGCITCPDLCGKILDETHTYSINQYIELLKSGNIFITKVEEI